MYQESIAEWNNCSEADQPEVCSEADQTEVYAKRGYQVFWFLLLRLLATLVAS